MKGLSDAARLVSEPTPGKGARYSFVAFRRAFAELPPTQSDKGERRKKVCMTDDRADVMAAPANDVNELENRASAAAHAKFAEWRKQERDQKPRRILMFTLAGIMITVATTLLVFLGQS